MSLKDEIKDVPYKALNIAGNTGIGISASKALTWGYKQIPVWKNAVANMPEIKANVGEFGEAVVNYGTPALGALATIGLGLLLHKGLEKITRREVR